MLFKRRKQSNDIVMIAINPMILLTSNLITDGNAASGPTHAFKIDSLQSLRRSLGILDWSAIMSDSWNHDDPSIKAVQKRKICSEALIANTIPTHMIEYIGANCDDTVDEIESRCSLAQVISVHAPNLYFDNSSRRTSLGSFYNRRR